MEQRYSSDNTDIKGGTNPVFGGEWTLEKLYILEKYMAAFTTILKKQSFKLIYIDAFAGTSKFVLKHDNVEGYTEGSVRRALKITNRSFDELIFVEKNHDLCEMLKNELVDCNRCEVIESDFNKYVKTIKRDWSSTRGVLFLDPFGTEVDWNTMEQIAKFTLDTWILYPTSAIIRLLPKYQLPDYHPGWSDKLNRIFGGDGWRCLYDKDPQQKLVGEPDPLRKSAADISNLYKEKLRELFEERFLNETRPLKRKNSVLFELMFCVGDPSGINIAERVVRHLLIKRAYSGSTLDEY